jgi:hypothetical protein
MKTGETEKSCYQTPGFIDIPHPTFPDDRGLANWLYLAFLALCATAPDCAATVTSLRRRLKRRRLVDD